MEGETRSDLKISLRERQHHDIANYRLCHAASSSEVFQSFPKAL